MTQTLAQLRAGQLQGCTRLQLAEGLEVFPPEIFSLADTLEVLDLSNNALSALPEDLWRLNKLRVLFCSNNHFTVLPELIALCPQLSMVGFKSNRIHTVPPQALGEQLRWFILTDNCLEELPSSIGRCTGLQKLMLAGNQLQALPDTLAQCAALELVRIAANQFQHFPQVLLALPNLAWLAFAGNPFCETSEAHGYVSATLIPWAQLTLGPVLGQGASGVIYQAQWTVDSDTRSVAVKLFKGAVTSDGWPHAEMTASLRAGTQAGLIPVLGQVHQHPEGAQGLVMALVPAHFRVLAGPPSLASCTRDVYAPELRLDGAALLRLAHTVASACAHLHAQGLVHGDLYAHNVLHSPENAVLLGDFGAASPTDALAPHVVQALQALDVRAFGVLLGECMARCDSDALPVPIWQGLQQVQAACVAQPAYARPSFANLVSTLEPHVSGESL
jgi:hypothetical protein